MLQMSCSGACVVYRTTSKPGLSLLFLSQLIIGYTPRAPINLTPSRPSLLVLPLFFLTPLHACTSRHLFYGSGISSFLGFPLLLKLHLYSCKPWPLRTSPKNATGCCPNWFSSTQAQDSRVPSVLQIHTWKTSTV